MITIYFYVNYLRMNETSNQLVVILDSIGRTIVGKRSAETDTILTLENPSVVIVQPNPSTNQIQLQLLPLFFKEFLSDKNQELVWNFNKGSITQSGPLVLGDQFVAQYENMWRSIVAPPQPDGEQVIQLFEE